jgi:hypothetical protein
MTMWKIVRMPVPGIETGPDQYILLNNITYIHDCIFEAYD